MVVAESAERRRGLSANGASTPPAGSECRPSLLCAWSVATGHARGRGSRRRSRQPRGRARHETPEAWCERLLRHGAAAGPGSARALARHVLDPDQPLDTAGLSYLRSLLAIAPRARKVPTGGIPLADVRQWLAAGATAVGVGRDLVEADDIAAALRQLLQVRIRPLRRPVLSQRRPPDGYAREWCRRIPVRRRLHRWGIGRGSR
jgi:hypothetical protein